MVDQKDVLKAPPRFKQRSKPLHEHPAGFCQAPGFKWQLPRAPYAATPVLRRLIAQQSGKNEIRVVVAGSSKKCSQKCYSMLAGRALAELRHPLVV